jgi:hypothetical protein
LIKSVTIFKPEFLKIPDLESAFAADTHQA